MRDADDRRRKAQLYRRLASIPTEGGHAADRALQVLAAKLEREGINDPIGANSAVAVTAAPMRSGSAKRARR
jgi:hypothetical protein